MPKKLTEEIKSSYPFIWAKSRGLNNREAGRFFDLFNTKDDIEKTPTIAIENYLSCCKEPKINQDALKNDAGIVTRSKLVMEYERHRRSFLTIAGIKNSAMRESLEKVMSKINTAELEASNEHRKVVLNAFYQSNANNGV